MKMGVPQLLGTDGGSWQGRAFQLNGANVPVMGWSAVESPEFPRAFRPREAGKHRRAGGLQVQF